MAEKRRAGASAKSAVPVKKGKSPEFNGAEFKAMLKNPTTAMKGLETFVSIARKLPCLDLYDVVEGYLKISMECAEIFQLLEGEKHAENETMLVFESLEVILLRTASDLSHFNMVGNGIVRKIVSSHMKLLQGSLHSANHRLVRHCLNLLSTMVSQGVEAAREVFSHIHIKALSGLEKRRDKLGRPDVRLAFIQFALSFLVSGDGAIIGQILEVKELLPHILSSGVREDRMSTVNLILSTLMTRVVLNKAISKTQKVRFFTPVVLSNIASLYRWKGIPDATTDDCDMVQDSSGVSVVRKLVHRFLLELCCSRKHGIIFHDAHFGTAGGGGNIVLLQFLVGLKQATEDELVAELVVNILKNSPDILSRYFKETQYSYTPRLKSAWQDNVNLLKKIYEAQPDISTVFQFGEMIPLSRLISMIMVISLPPVCNKTFFTQGLSLANNKVQLTTVSVINFVLKRTSKNIEYLLDKAVWERSDVYSAEMMEQLVQQYREALGKILPDMTTIISTWQSLSKKEKTEGDDNKSTGDGSADLAETKTDLPVAETTEVVLLKALILQVICLYQRVMPHLVLQCKFDFSKLLKGIVSEKGMKEEVPPVLQYQILQLALDLPASKFSWFHIQEVADADSAEKSVLYLLLKMFISSSRSHLRSSTQKLVVKVLQDTGVFEHTWMELELWLNQLDRVKPNQQETVIQFLERVFVKLVCNSYEYTDKVASLVQEAAYLQANLSSQEGDASSLPVSHIDDVLDMLDIIMEGSEGEMEEFGPTLSEELIIQTFPFSAVVPAALEARNKLKSDKGEVCEYLSAVLSDVLHCQRDPLPLCLALLHYDKELVSSGTPASSHLSVLHLHQYYSSWLPQQSREELFKSSACLSNEELTSNSFSTLMKAAYMQGPSTLTTNTFRKNIEAALDSMLLAEFPIAIKQVLLYVKSTVENFGTFSKETGTALLKTLMGILQDMMTKLQSFAETQNSEAAPAEEEQDASDLFLDVNQSSMVETNKNQILVAALGSIFKHPCLEQWFLALELSALPPHSLKPVRLKHLCALMTDGTLTLLQIGAPVLRDLCHAELLSGCMSAIKRAVLKELSEKRPHPPKSHSRTFQALLSLHSYMDSSNLREVALSLLLQPQDTLICVSSETAGSDLSIYGHAALQILTTRTSMTSEDDCAFLTPAHLQGLSTLLLSCSSPEPAALMLQTLSREPSFAKLMHTDVLSRCLQEPLPDFLAINSLLLQNCSSHRLCFELWCLEPANMAKLSRETEAFLPLINTYLEVASREDPARPKAVQKEVLKALKQALLDKLPQGILGNLTDDREIAATVANLIKLSTDIKDFWDLISYLPSVLPNADSFQRWKLVDVITDKLVDYPEELEKWRKSVSIAALKCLTASFCGSKDPSAAATEQEHSVLQTLKQLLAFAEDIPASEWNSFVKSGLKYRYRDSCFLNTLSSLLAVMYGEEEVQKDLLPLSTLHLMISSHSQFLPTMLGCGEEPDKSPEKEALVSLLLCVVKKCPKVCNISHFVVLLGAYSATLSTSDQKLLLLLQEYERNQASLLKFQSFLWGPAAVEHHKTRKSLGASLWKQASSDELLALLKTDRMLQTISQFPQQRRIILQDEVEQLYSNKAVKDLSNLYDPCFLLPLFSVILRPECVIDCHKFISSHALGFTIMALSSSDPKVRAAAYHVLGSFYQHLEGARFREKRQMLYLMDIVKNGIQRQNQRVPFVLTSYIAKVAQQMLRPEDHMYVVLNKFLLSQQSLDLKRVPEFFKLFYSFDLEHKMEREWILNVLGEGINDDHCFKLCNQQGIFQSLLGFGSSPLCDETFQVQIIRVLCKAARVTKGAYNLTKSSGILSWMIHFIEKKNLTQQLLCSVVDLLCVLWFTNLGEKEKKADGAGASSPSGEKPQGAVKYLPLPFINEFLCAASAVCRHLRLGVKAAQLSMFVQMLSTALMHRGTALSVNKQAEWLTLRPQPLSSAESLTLLHCWATLSHNAALLSQIQELSNRHKVAELMGMGKDKFRGKRYSSRTRGENSAEDDEGDKQESLLRECKPSLCSIFIHWEPELHSSEAQSAVSKDGLEPRLLACDTAHLLTRWSLKWLLEDAYEDDKAKQFLLWFEKAVQRHRKMVKAVMLDPGLKADLLCLYHRSFETDSSSTATLKRFTHIMIRMLETEGQLTDYHRAVMSACIQEPSHESRQEAGLFLLSMFIHELWSGAASAELFLSYVGLVTKTKNQKPKGSKSSKTQTAVRAICEEIVAIKI
ncbi:nucleolar pre-ribosomal-associated protein 1 [Oryzias latipes]|uniref:URB1 ribosome biogenesis homolog n=1 Tax=Oryzias latipes TaxID=8090 RepID=H2LE93_ORYLA|nr:nucleolar pre-ribosomal-associated protein 1 [Oryzias latipes]